MGLSLEREDERKLKVTESFVNDGANVGVLL